MDFLILVSLVLLNIQIYRLSKLLLIIDEQSHDFASFRGDNHVK